MSILIPVLVFITIFGGIDLYILERTKEANNKIRVRNKQLNS